MSKRISVEITMLEPPLPDGAMTLVFKNDGRKLAMSAEDWVRVKPLMTGTRDITLSVLSDDGRAVISGTPGRVVEGERTIKKARSMLMSVLVTPLKNPPKGAVSLGMSNVDGEAEEIFLSEADAEKVRRLMKFKRKGQRMSTIEEGDQIRIMLE